jgi:hypothetical protein
MKPPVLVLAALALLGALLLCAQRWGYQAGRMACGVQLASGACTAAGNTVRCLPSSTAAFW